MRKVCLRIHSLALILLALLGLADESIGQNVQTLIQFTNTWQYDQSGRNLSTTKWYTNDYVLDGQWQPASRGLLGFDTTPDIWTVHAPITTPLTISTTVTTYYFRTTFQFSGSTAGMSLLASNLVDDGCVIYLNGREAGRVRVPANQTAATLATGGTEGAIELVNINPTFLRQGANLMAVEVHQSAADSSDVMFGMKLLAITPTALVITNQPDSVTAPVGSTVSFSVGVQGGPAFYQWQRNGANIIGQNGPTYTINNVQLSQAGTYRVIVTNAVSSLISSNAVLTVDQDTTGPTLVSAVVQDRRQTNEIIIQFNEVVLSGTNVTDVSKYRINVCGSPNTVIISNAAWGGSQVQLRVGGPNWTIGGCYYLTVNNVTDTRTNSILPNSQIGISFPVRTNAVVTENFWYYHAAWFFELEFDKNDIYTNNWMAPNYQMSSRWGSAIGPCWKDPNLGGACLGTFDASGTIGYQTTPTLFRTYFVLPPDASSNATVKLNYQFDDGLVLYLNGTELFRQNMPANTNRVDRNTLATSTVGSAECFERTITTNLFVPGTNWLAAAVCQSTSNEGDTIFGLEMELTTLKTGTVPVKPYLFHARVNNPNRLGLWWTNAGAILETSTTLGTGATWSTAPSQTNPQTNPVTGNRFYRLRQ